MIVLGGLAHFFGVVLGIVVYRASEQTIDRCKMFGMGDLLSLSPLDGIIAV